MLNRLQQLVAEDAVPWLPEVRQSMVRHECKHLLSIVMDWLPIFDFEESSEFNKREARRRQLMVDYDAGIIKSAAFLARLDEDQVSFPEQVENALKNLPSRKD